MCNINWIDEDLKYIWHPCSQMKDYEELNQLLKRIFYQVNVES